MQTQTSRDWRRRCHGSGSEYKKNSFAKRVFRKIIATLPRTFACSWKYFISLLSNSVTFSYLVHVAANSCFRCFRFKLKNKADGRFSEVDGNEKLPKIIPGDYCVASHNRNYRIKMIIPFLCLMSFMLLLGKLSFCLGPHFPPLCVRW